MPQMTFKAFELQERERSPNAVIGIAEDGKRVFITAPFPGLGKELGDEIAINIKIALENIYTSKLKFHRIVANTPKKINELVEWRMNSLDVQHDEGPGTQVECPGCHTVQDHTYPMTGKLYCQGCGELLVEIDT